MIKRKPLGGLLNTLQQQQPKPTVVRRPAVQSTFVNLEVHFKGNFKLMTCRRSWNHQEALAYIANELSVPQEVQDTYDPCTVSISLIKKEGAFVNLETLLEVEDGMRILIDCQVKSYKEQTRQNALVGAGTAVIV